MITMLVLFQHETQHVDFYMKNLVLNINDSLVERKENKIRKIEIILTILLSLKLEKVNTKTCFLFAAA